MLRPAPPPRVYSQGGRAIAWIEAHCVHSRGPWRGRALRLLPWQRELLWRLLELRPREGAAPELWPRRYRRALIGLPAGNGKSELLAALGLWLLVDDGGPAPEIAVAGASDRAAAVAFGAARSMCELSPGLRALTSCWERAIEVPLRPAARGSCAWLAGPPPTWPRATRPCCSTTSSAGRCPGRPRATRRSRTGPAAAPSRCWCRWPPRAGTARRPVIASSPTGERYASARTTIAASSSPGSRRPRSWIRPRNGLGARRTRPRG